MIVFVRNLALNNLHCTIGGFQKVNGEGTCASRQSKEA